MQVLKYLNRDILWKIKSNWTQSLPLNLGRLSFAEYCYTTKPSDKSCPITPSLSPTSFTPCFLCDFSGLYHHYAGTSHPMNVTGRSPIHSPCKNLEYGLWLGYSFWCRFTVVCRGASFENPCYSFAFPASEVQQMQQDVNLRGEEDGNNEWFCSNLGQWRLLCKSEWLSDGYIFRVKHPLTKIHSCECSFWLDGDFRPWRMRSQAKIFPSSYARFKS